MFYVETGMKELIISSVNVSTCIKRVPAKVQLGGEKDLLEIRPKSRHTKDFKNGTWYLLA